MRRGAHGRGQGPCSCSARGWLAVVSWSLICGVTCGASPASTSSAPAVPQSAPSKVLALDRWQMVNRTVDKALVYLASQQREDGCFRGDSKGQPAVTAVAALAFLSAGHLPGQGRYGEVLDRAVDYVLSCQHEDGLFSVHHPEEEVSIRIAETAAANHALGGLLLSEVYGMYGGSESDRIRRAIEAALEVALRRYPQPKRHRADVGGWRYLRMHQRSDSDLTVTCWYLMFLRSCRNAGFEVPVSVVDEAAAFVRRCYDPDAHFFWYALRGREHLWMRGVTGAGILSLSLAGLHETEMAREAGRWLLDHPFDRYRGTVGRNDRFFYGAFTCSNAMFQLGGRYWADFYPVLARTLVHGQLANGSWHKEPRDRTFGHVYSTSLAVLALSPPYQLLPVFQR